MFRMENWRGNMIFQKRNCLFFTATEVVRVWQQRENLCAEDIEHGRS